MKDAKTIHIRRPSIVREIQAEQRRIGDSSPTDFVLRLLSEWRAARGIVRPARRKGKL